MGSLDVPEEDIIVTDMIFVARDIMSELTLPLLVTASTITTTVVEGKESLWPFFATVMSFFLLKVWTFSLSLRGFNLSLSLRMIV